MPKGPKGEKRPADVVGRAIKIAKIATGESDEDTLEYLGRKRSGMAGAKARSKKLTPEQRSRIASLAAKARWEKKG
jgi:hypothetical protein